MLIPAMGSEPVFVIATEYGKTSATVLVAVDPIMAATLDVNAGAVLGMIWSHVNGVSTVILGTPWAPLTIVIASNPVIKTGAVVIRVLSLGCLFFSRQVKYQESAHAKVTVLTTKDLANNAIHPASLARPDAQYREFLFVRVA